MADRVLLPGDSVETVTDSNRRFLVERNGQFSTKVVSRVEQGEFKVCKAATVPQLHDIVIGRVIRSRMKEVRLVLLTANGVALQAPLLAELRAADVQEKDVDSVIASKIFKPGDLVRARVVALGRSGFYAQLSTAEEGLGVYNLEKKSQ